MPLAMKIIVLPLVLFALLVAALWLAYRKTVGEIEELDLSVRARCDSCGREFSLSTGEFRRGLLTKSVSLGRTAVRGPMLVTRRTYCMYKKRFACPSCGKVGWCEVLNIDDLQRASSQIAFRNFGGALLACVVVGFALQALFS